MSALTWSTTELGETVVSYSPTASFHSPTVEPPTEKDLILSKLKSLGAYLAGSRGKLSRYNLSEDTDWDFQIDQTDDPWSIDDSSMWSEDPWLETELSKFLSENFTVDEKSEYEQSEDITIVRVWKHNTYPLITVVSRTDLYNWKRMWDSISPHFFRLYLWKSNPKVQALSTEEFKIWRTGVVDIFNQLYTSTRVPELKSYE